MGGLSDTRQLFSPEARLFLLIGCLGGFTTFSTFSYETLGLAREAATLQALANIAIHLGAGLAAVWLGYALAVPREPMMLPAEGHLLRIFLGESDRHEGMPLYEWIVRKAREHGVAGATVLRGLEGLGAHSRIHTAKILRLSTDLPIVVEIEIVDTREKIEDFLPTVDEAIEEGLATIEKVEIRFYRSGSKPAPPSTGE